jgi:D-threo-aldose 1-dehydrogenase
MPNPFRTVQLGRTSLEVTQFGLGTAQFGFMYAPVEDADAQETVRQAHSLGCRFFDTSPMYGGGLAEGRLGAVLSGLPRESFVLSDKVGYVVDAGASSPTGDQPPGPLGHDYSYDGAFRLVEGSLKRLGLDRIDILLIHDPDYHMDEALSGSYPALRQMREQGVVSAIGAGMNDSALLTRLAQEGDFDCFLMAGRYTLLDQTALQNLMPVAEERGIAIYIGGPFNSGILANPYAENATFNYRPADAQWVQKARQIDAVCQRYNVPLKAAALQFPLGHPAVVSVVSGARSVAELEENLAMFRFEIPSALWDDLRSEGLIDPNAPTP